MHYLISSPTRVGSHYLIALVGAAGVSTEKTHNPKLEVDYVNTFLVTVSRRNKFWAILSASIGRVTHQYNNYELADVEPFAISQEVFRQEFLFNIYYQQQHDFSQPWAGIEHFYFEDFLNHHDHVFNRLNLIPVNKIDLPKKSPFNYRKIITNIEECREYYQHLQDTEPKFIPKEQFNGLFTKSN